MNDRTYQTQLMEVTEELIRKYHLGECSDAEKLAVEKWLDSEDFQMSYPEDADLNDEQQKGWAKLSTRYGIAQDQVSETPKDKKTHLNVKLWIPVAACLALVFAFGLNHYFFSNKVQTADTLNTQVVNAKKGEKKHLILPDGTEVWLNSESTLSFPKEFTAVKRAVDLEGEAFFKVTKNPAKPFIISSARSTTKVLGTRFNLRDYQNEEKTELVVEEGKVRFSSKKTEAQLILTANQKGFIESNGALSAVQNINSSRKFTDWKENRLVLDDITLQEIQPILERWYGVEIKIANKELYHQRYKGSFNNPSLPEVLKSICFATRTTYTQQHQTFILGK